MYTYIYIYICMCTHIHMHMHIHIHIYIYTKFGFPAGPQLLGRRRLDARRPPEAGQAAVYI